MLIELDLNHKDAEALLRHCAQYQQDSGDFREDAKLRDGLEALADAIHESMRAGKAQRVKNLCYEGDRAR
ncbi:hypothetical protein [Pseudomonas sp. UBA1879]|uniref:hypothetical protein n=1 Tax=Pseudomonas sp. UBA1879 TaxID=1947305 RepID=UPI0025E54BC8|nr:hypothetical protein [Pseudomonas sp. UBA1879]